MLAILNRSEKEFEARFEALCSRRVEKEQIYASIKNTPSRNLLSTFFSAEEERAATKIQVINYFININNLTDKHLC